MPIKLQSKDMPVAEQLLNQTKTLLIMQQDYFATAAKAKRDKRLYTQANAIKTGCKQMEQQLISALSELEKGAES